ncbi:glycosyltransferase family 2 protein [Flavobacterium oreochromis]|uniref:glycosyltransferase family 2 protein n=1 Tax=Flavobacterium oreochromis TaxID=2906078 RepID=UPI0038582325
MIFTLIICTYKRAKSIVDLLDSVGRQTVYPTEILVIDGSPDNETNEILAQRNFKGVKYFQVSEKDRGLTKQRNYGVSKVRDDAEVVSFLDDDTILEPNYFEELIKTFQNDNDVCGVGGVAINENGWIENKENKFYNPKRFYHFEGYVYKEGLRNVLRNYLGLQSNLGPGKMPLFSHGRTCGFPLNDKTYEVDLLIGMSFAFRKKVFESIQFSKYFEGYGLYEDADFSIRAQKFGKNVINTKVQLHHFHAPGGRPNLYQYGKMVVRNGWYVWRVKNPKPKIIHRIKWHSITLLLLLLRFSNTFTSSNSKQGFTESIGRFVGWLSLLINKPKFE